MNSIPLVNEFIEALELLQFPDVAFKVSLCARELSLDILLKLRSIEKVFRPFLIKVSKIVFYYLPFESFFNKESPQTKNG